MASLDGAWQAAREVEQASLPDYPNHERPNIKLALWAATMSAQNQLSWNGLQVHALRPYAARELPTSVDETLAIIRSGHTFAYEQTAVHVNWVDWAAREGLLDPFTHKPSDYAGWLDWRKRLYRVASGHGFSWKTLSFAGLLMWPTECQLVPVDRHVMARLGRPSAHCGRLGAWKLYNEVEQEVVEEWLSAGRPYTIGVWHWYKWSAWRQAKGVEPAGECCESHALLSPYAY